LTGNSRTKESPIDTKVFTGELRVDTDYVHDFNHPKDNTIGGSSEVFRSGEFHLTQFGIGGDFHWQNVRGRLMTQFGLYSQTTPRNDASPGRGQWNLDNAYRYLSEAYGGYHLDVMNGINIQAGIFMSYVGLWSYYNFDNWTYQPSYVSSNTPWFFNGLRIQIFPSDKLKIEPWIINGWQSYGKFNHAPGLGGQVLWRPNGSVSILANNYWGTDTLGNPDRKRVHQDAHLVRDYLDPGRRLTFAYLRPCHHKGRHLDGLGRHLDDVALPDPVGRDVHFLAVDEEVAVSHQLAGHVPALRETGPVDHVVEPGLQDLEQVLAGPATLAGGLLVVAMELALEDSVDPAGLLLLPDLEQVLALLRAVPAVLTRWVRPDLDGALGRIALGPLQEELHLLAAAELAVRARVSSHLRATPQTRRRFGGRQPLCGTGVTSWIEPTSRPVACSDRMAVSRPDPGPLTNTSTLRIPCSMARRAAASAAICAANGVDLRDPLNPTWPDDAQEMTLPTGSVIETMVLLNVLLMWACP